MRWTLILCLLSVRLVQCGGATQSQPDATVDGSSTDALSDSYSGPTDANTEKPWPIIYNIVDGGGDGADCYDDANVVQACCNGQQCRGFCVLDDDGAVECSCYGIGGGCTGENNGTPNVCCSKYRGCIDLNGCTIQK